MSPLSVNAAEKKSTVGFKDLYIAEVTQDDASAYVSDTPESLAPAAEGSWEPTQSMETQYADDQPYDNVYAEGETKITLTVTGLPPAMEAKITGRIFDAASGRVFDHGGTPPFCALSFRSLKSNGKYRYYQYLKGTFSVPKGEATTKGATPQIKTVTLEFTAIKTIYKWALNGTVTDGVKRIYSDEDTTNFSGTSFFSQVQVPSVVAPSALALDSSDPADGATGVLVTKTITLTFNNALPAGEIYHVVVTQADGTVVACTNSLDTTKKIMTVNPDASLAASTVHIVAIGVTDIYGDTLQTAINFTTA